MHGRAPSTSAVLAGTGTAGDQDCWCVPAAPMSAGAVPGRELQIMAHKHARMVEEKGERKNRGNIQGTLEIRVWKPWLYLEQGKENGAIRSNKSVFEQINGHHSNREP